MIKQGTKMAACCLITFTNDTDILNFTCLNNEVQQQSADMCISECLKTESVSCLCADRSALQYSVYYNSLLPASGLRENTDPAELLL